MAALFAMRCDAGRRTIVFSRAGSPGAPFATMTFTTSFGAFAVSARDGGAGGMIGELPSGDARLDQLATGRPHGTGITPGRAPAAADGI